MLKAFCNVGHDEDMMRSLGHGDVKCEDEDEDESGEEENDNDIDAKSNEEEHDHDMEDESDEEDKEKGINELLREENAYIMRMMKAEQKQKDASEFGNIDDVAKGFIRNNHGHIKNEHERIEPVLKFVMKVANTNRDRARN